LNRLELPKNLALRGKVIDAQIEHESRRLERGIMGAILGSGPDKPGNLAGFAIVVSCFMILALAWFAKPDTVPWRELIMIFGTAIPTALGYFFGYLTGTKVSGSSSN
jgi:hypothetical protein